jgi:hypothetical protein
MRPLIISVCFMFIYVTVYPQGLVITTDKSNNCYSISKFN